MLMCCFGCGLVVEIVGASSSLSFECRDCGTALEPADAGVDPLATREPAEAA